MPGRWTSTCSTSPLCPIPLCVALPGAQIFQAQIRSQETAICLAGLSLPLYLPLFLSVSPPWLTHSDVNCSMEGPTWPGTEGKLQPTTLREPNPTKNQVSEPRCSPATQNLGVPHLRVLGCWASAAEGRLPSHRNCGATMLQLQVVF